MTKGTTTEGFLVSKIAANMLADERVGRQIVSRRGT